MEVAFVNHPRSSVHNATNHQPMHIHRPSKIKALFASELWSRRFFMKVRQRLGWNMIYDLCYWAFEAMPKDRADLSHSPNSSLQNSFIK
jgi:hypothetical protein